MGFLLSALYLFFLSLLMGSTIENRKYCHIILCELLRKKKFKILKGSAVRLALSRKGFLKLSPTERELTQQITHLSAEILACDMLHCTTLPFQCCQLMQITQ